MIQHHYPNSRFKRIERQADVTGTVVRRVMGVLGAAISTRQLVAYAAQWRYSDEPR